MFRWKAILFTIIVLLLFACRDNGSTTSLSSESVTEDNLSGQITDKITIRTIVYDWHRSQYDDLVEIFETENPDIEIKLISLEDILDLDQNNDVSWPEDTPMRLVTAADVLTADLGHGLAEQGLLLNLRPLMESDSSFDLNDFYPYTLEQHEWNGGIWGLPFEAHFTLLYFNKDLFDAAGVAYPRAGWTWEDMLATAQAVTVRSDDQVETWGLVESYPGALTFVQARVGPLFDITTTPPTPLLAEANVHEAVRWYTDLVLVHNVSPYLEQPESNEDGTFYPSSFDLVENGQAAMWPEGAGAWEWRSNQMNIGVVPFPVSSTNDHTTPVYSNGYAISAGTQNPEAAWRWIHFLSRQVIGDGVDGLSARRSVVEASGLWEQLDEELATTLQYAINHSYIIAHNTVGYSYLQEAIEAIIRDGATVEEALTQAQAEAEAWIDNAAEAQTGDAPVPEISVVIEEETALNDAVPITFTVSGAGRLQPYQDLAQKFHEIHPDIILELQAPDFNSGPTNLRNIAAHADCFEWFAILDDEKDRAAILNLEPYLNIDTNLNQDTFFPVAIDQVTYQGQMWGLPASIRLSTIDFNKELFDAANVPYPTVDWTTEEFLETAVALTQGDEEESKRFGYLADVFESNSLLLFLDLLDAQLVDGSVDPPLTTFDHSSTVEAMRWYTNLSNELGVKPVFVTNPFGGVGSAQQEWEHLIRDGRAAMWLSSSVGPFDRMEVDFDIGYAPLPAGPNGRNNGGILGISAYFISANASSSTQQACWEWITFLSEQPSATTGLPARHATAESRAYWQLVGEERAQVYLASIEAATATDLTLNLTGGNNWRTVWQLWMVEAYDRIINEGVTVTEALTQAQAKADEYRNCIASIDGGEEILQTCLETVKE